MHKLSSIPLTNNAPAKYGVLIVRLGINATYCTVYYTMGVYRDKGSHVHNRKWILSCHVFHVLTEIDAQVCDLD